MPDTPSRMPWDTYERRVLAWTSALLALHGPVCPPDALCSEATALFDSDDSRILGLMLHPPMVCPTCGASHRSPVGSTCYACRSASERSDYERRIRADERAKVLAEQKAATDAEVSADLAQKGEF